MPHKLALERRSQRQLILAVLYRQLSRLVDRALGGSRKRQRWALRGPLRVPSPVRDGEGWTYRTTFNFERRGRIVAATIESRQFEYITRIVEVAGNARGWTIPGRPGVQTTPAEPTPAGVIRLPESTTEHFAHIYDREQQVGIVTQAIKAAISSRFQNRNHCVLFGPPACGKSEILLAFKKMLGADAVMQFDATSTTGAGARRELRQLANIPPILIVEEIEETDERSLRWLLGVLDMRGEIRGVNYRDANFQRDVKLLCSATANDLDRFNSVMAGALASRFANKVRCPRPSEAVLTRILEREVDRVKGDRAWIAPALKYCIYDEHTDDPRRVIAVCLCGQEKLLTGEYQRWLAATRE